jgi:LmbE family N-acetylglucosaminyl deacetylase
MFKFTRRPRTPSFPTDLPRCELPAALDLTTARRVLVFAPHPDDEVLGCGGTLALLAPHSVVRIVLVTDGSGGGELPAEIGPKRRAEWVESLALLGITDVTCLNWPDGEVLPEPLGERLIAQEISAFQPNWVFTPGMTDYHRDHMAIAQMVQSACQKNPAVQLLLAYEIWAPVWATHTVDITSVTGLKREALQLQKTSLQYGNYLQAIEGLNLYRGLYLGRPNASAEAFAVVDLWQKKEGLRCRQHWLDWLTSTGI